jgi:hypothetical protein
VLLPGSTAEGRGARLGCGGVGCCSGFRDDEALGALGSRGLGVVLVAGTGFEPVTFRL